MPPSGGKIFSKNRAVRQLGLIALFTTMGIYAVLRSAIILVFVVADDFFDAVLVFAYSVGEGSALED